MRLVQLLHPEHGRRVAAVHGDELRLLESHSSVYGLAAAAIAHGESLRALAELITLPDALNYEEIYTGRSEWRLLPAFDHPEETACCIVAGTGLTHLAGAKNRNAMHSDATAAPVSDSMRMYQWGVDGGRPAAGTIGVQPEWFYKGTGAMLKAHGEPLTVPAFAEDGGEEPEIAGAYIIDPSDKPRRVGMMIGNEFSDHVMEKKNYLYLAPSKLRNCSVGPELVVDPDFGDVTGTARVLRNGEAVWQKDLRTGEANMSHTRENLEHHHFKYPGHRRQGDVHIHFFGAGAFSFGDGIALQEGDVMEVQFEGFGRALRNPLALDRAANDLVAVTTL